MSRFVFISVLVACSLLVTLAASPVFQEAPPSQEKPQEKPPLTGINHKAKVENCRKCHLDVMDEWEHSLHAKSWSNPVFQAAVKRLGPKGEACARCHAPDSVPLVGAGNLPHARPEHRELGVNCVTCHLDGKKYFGPHRSKGHGGIVVEKAYQEALFCSSCHGQEEVNKAHDAYTSYLKSPAAAAGKKCQDCHMETVHRKMVKSKRKLRRNVQPARDCKTHVFAGAHTSGKAAGAARLSGEIKDGKLSLKIQPETGHDLPASTGREVRLTVQMLDADGKTIKKRHRTWDLSRGKVLSPGSDNLQIFDLDDGVVAVEADLVLILSRVPGRPKAISMPIATVKLN